MDSVAWTPVGPEHPLPLIDSWGGSNAEHQPRCERASRSMAPGEMAEATVREWPDSCSEVLEFRRCRLVPAARLLFRGDRPVALGSRAFDLLHVLLRSRGAVVSKKEIVAEVWPQLSVEDSNLRFQIASLRKALGPDSDLVKTIPGRGYLFATDPPHLAAPRDGASAIGTIGSLSGSEMPALFDAARAERLSSLLRYCVGELRRMGVPGGDCDRLAARP